MRRDNRWEPSDQINGYIGSVGINTFPPPSAPPYPSHLSPRSPRSSSSSRLASELSPTPSEPLDCRTADAVELRIDEQQDHSAPRRCSAAHHRIRVCVALIQS